MAVSKVQFGGQTLIDLTSDTVTSGTLLSGYTAHKNDGTTITGTIANGTITNNTSGGTSSGTINSGSQIKIGAGYYSSDKYYTAQSAIVLSGDAAVGDVLSGKTFYSTSATKQTGTMTNNGAVSPSALSCDGSYTIPAGYHNGSGVVTAKSLSSQTGVDTGSTAITSGTVLSGYQGWVNGTKISGGMTNRGAVTNTITTQNGTYTIPAGYHNGSGYVKATLPSATFEVSGASVKTKSTGAGYVLANTTVGTVATTSRTAGAGSASLSGSNVTLGTTNNGISVTATGSGSVSTGTGYITTGSTSSNSATTTKYISAVTIPATKSLSVTNSGTLTLSNTDGSTSDITFANDGTTGSTVNISTMQSGSHTQISGSPSIFIDAYDIFDEWSTDPKQVVSYGNWCINEVWPSYSKQGPFFGATYVYWKTNAWNTATATLSADGNTLTFTGLTIQPKAFIANFTTNQSSYNQVTVGTARTFSVACYSGITVANAVATTVLRETSRTTVVADNTYLNTISYSSGTLTITVKTVGSYNGYFRQGDWQLRYLT